MKTLWKLAITSSVMASALSLFSACAQAVEPGYYKVQVTLETGLKWEECWHFDGAGTLTTKNFIQTWKMAYAQNALDTDSHSWQALLHTNYVGSENFALHGTSRAPKNQDDKVNGNRSAVSGNGIRHALYIIPNDDDYIVTFVFKGSLQGEACM